jgi:hypothetical protein
MISLEDALKLNPVSLSVSKKLEIIEFRNYISEITSFLDKEFTEVKIATRIYCIINNITSIPICPACGKYNVPLKEDYKKGFTKFCSIPCARVSSDLSEEKLSLLKDKDWLYNQRITQRKSWDSISDEFEISTPVIRKWSKIHSIPEVNYNKNDMSVEMILSSKEKMEELYQNKTVYEIAELLGTSPSNVAYRISGHGIIAKSSNDYPRKHVKVSNGCQEIIDYIKTIYQGEVIVNARGIIPSKELDIYIPDLKFAIEYNGVWSHLYRPHETTDSKIKGKNYHRGKSIAARERGIHLMHIWSSQWDIKKDIIKSMISSKMGLSETKVWARKCTVEEISSNEKSLFLDENHLQGRDKSSFFLGLRNGDDLVAVMTFGRSRYNKSYKWELVRFAVKKGVSVPGGFSRLLKEFRRKHEGSIISYADFSHSYGNVYLKNGFEVITENPASYWYVAKNSEIMQHRFKFRKKNIAIEGDNRTEEQIMFSMGYSKIFDCGTIAFGLNFL